METVKSAHKESLERIAIFIDYHNLEGSLRNENYQTNMLSLRNYLADGRWLLETMVYVGFNPNNLEEDGNFHRFLRMHGFIVCTKPAKIKPDGTLKCDLDIELAIGVIDYVLQTKPSVVVLLTGDGDFVTLVNWLRLRGVRVEVASTPNSLSQDLRESANDYIDLCEAIDEIQRGDKIQRKEVYMNDDGDNQRSEA